VTIALQAWVLVLTSFIGQTGAGEVSPQLEAFAQQRDQIRTLQAHFTQQTITPDETIESSGTVVYVNPKRIIFRYDDMDMEYMIDAQNAYEYDAELEQVLIYDIAGRPEAAAFFMGFENNADELQKAYHVKVLSPRNATTHAFALELVPRPSETEDPPLFERVLLQIRRDDYLPTEIDITNDAESNVSFHVQDFVLNETLPPKVSSLFVPAGTDVVINDDIADPVEDGGRFYPLPATEDSILPEHSGLEPLTGATPLQPADSTP
jgi:outer membrane lipoprotein-sorting protein